MASEVVDVREAQRFEIRTDGELAGFVTYARGDGTVSMMHTEIASAFEGQGLGSILVRGALDAARGEGVGVLPYCPFVRSYVQRHPEYVDLVPQARRSEFGLSGTT